MDYSYATKFVRKLTGVTENQLKYWVRLGIVVPKRISKAYYYPFREIIKIRVLVQLRRNGLSLQKIRKGIKNLFRILPTTEDHLTRLMIYTNGVDMIVVEKGHYYSAITNQRYIAFDTSRIKSEIIELQKSESNYAKNENIVWEKEIHKIIEA